MSTTKSLSARFLLAYAFLALTLHELHEIAHTVTGRILCGAWGERDFNVWRLAEGCASYWPTAMGPLFSYGVMYIGVLLMRKEKWRAFGVAIALGANPFARLLTVLTGGGDEGVIARALTGGEKTLALRLAVIGVVALLCTPVFTASWRALRGVRRRAGVFTLLLLLPTLLTGVLYMLIGNRLLHAGVGASPLIFGDPLLLFGTNLVALIATLATVRWLFPQAREVVAEERMLRAV